MTTKTNEAGQETDENSSISSGVSVESLDRNDYDLSLKQLDLKEQTEEELPNQSGNLFETDGNIIENGSDKPPIQDEKGQDLFNPSQNLSQLVEPPQLNRTSQTEAEIRKSLIKYYSFHFPTTAQVMDLTARVLPQQPEKEETIDNLALNNETISLIMEIFPFLDTSSPVDKWTQKIDDIIDFMEDNKDLQSTGCNPSRMNWPPDLDQPLVNFITNKYKNDGTQTFEYLMKAREAIQNKIDFACLQDPSYITGKTQPLSSKINEPVQNSGISSETNGLNKMTPGGQVTP